MSNHKFWITLAIAVLFITGCVNKAPVVVKKPVPEVKKPKPKPKPKAPKKGKLVEVQDGNFSSSYMYPETKRKKEKVVKVAEAENAPTVATTANAMSKNECVGMIGQEKFDKYTQMFGNEASSIKRCAMLKSMK